VHPCLPPGAAGVRSLAVDPLLAPERSVDLLRRARRNGAGSSFAFVPRSRAADVLATVSASAPHTRRDLTALLPEVGLRAAYRLTTGRHVF
jgi:hypothetical protein